MKRKPLFLGMALFAIVTTFMIVACTKNDTSQEMPSAGKQAVSLYLTDGPGFFDQVNVDIQSVKVLIDTCSGSGLNYWSAGYRDSCVNWEDLQIRAGVYDLLSLRNGVDTLLAQGNITKGKIKLIKIQLGTNNSVVKDSVTYPLNLPRADSSATIFIRLRGDEWEEYASGRNRLWLDFDVERSIIRVRDNSFFLIPVLHCFVVKATGSVQGKVLPYNAYPVISLYKGTDTAYALPSRSGEFKIRGLAPGTYSAFINASNGYQDTTITNVTVTTGRETKIGIINLHK